MREGSKLRLKMGHGLHSRVSGVYISFEAQFGANSSTNASELNGLGC